MPRLYANTKGDTLNRPDGLQPFLRVLGNCGREFATRVGSSLIPIVSPDPEPFDCDEYGIRLTFIIDGTRLSAQQALSLAEWIAEDTDGDLFRLLSDVQHSKCHLQDDKRYETVMIDPTAGAWG